MFVQTRHTLLLCLPGQRPAAAGECAPSVTRTGPGLHCLALLVLDVQPQGGSTCSASRSNGHHSRMQVRRCCTSDSRWRYMPPISFQACTANKNTQVHVPPNYAATVELVAPTWGCWQRCQLQRLYLSNYVCCKGTAARPTCHSHLRTLVFKACKLQFIQSYSGHAVVLPVLCQGTQIVVAAASRTPTPDVARAFIESWVG